MIALTIKHLLKNKVLNFNYETWKDIVLDI